MNALSNNEKLKAFVTHNMIDLPTLIDNNVKFSVYTGGEMN